MSRRETGAPLPLRACGAFFVASVAALAGCAAGAARGSGHAPAPRTASENDSPIPADPNLLHGTLANGFSYFLRRDGQPSGRVSLGLVVKAGSANEGQGQDGLAHLVQHMAFEGTGKFEKDKLAELLRHLGLQPAPDRQVATSVDFTVYGLD